MQYISVSAFLYYIKSFICSCSVYTTNKFQNSILIINIVRSLFIFNKNLTKLPIYNSEMLFLDFITLNYKNYFNIKQNLLCRLVAIKIKIEIKINFKFRQIDSLFYSLLF
jgi:hypothetical protein